MGRDLAALPELGAGYRARAGRLEDAAAVAELMNGYWELLLQARKFTPEGKRAMFDAPGFDVERSTHLVETAAGKLAGYVAVLDTDAPPVSPALWGGVTAAHQRLGLGTHLLAWAEMRAREAIARVPDGVRVAAQAWIFDTHEPTRRLFESRGYAPRYYSLIMNIGLEAAPAEPIWPEGIVLRTFREAPDVGAVMAADREAFRDHRGFVEKDADAMREQWEHFVANDPNFDPVLWFLAMDGDRIVGIALCAPQLGDEDSIGVMETLGVVREWRRQGLGMALLLHAFHALRERGKTVVTLSVDANSLTGATRLYERAGMHVYRQMTMYELELRPGKELGTQSLT